MKRYITKALTKERHLCQEEIYRQHHPYDYVIIGTGMSALSAGAHLTAAGHRVCMLAALPAFTGSHIDRLEFI